MDGGVGFVIANANFIVFYAGYYPTQEYSSFCAKVKTLNMVLNRNLQKKIGNIFINCATIHQALPGI